MFLFFSSFSTILLIPKGKWACTSLQHMASRLTLVTSALDSSFNTAFTLLEPHWYSFCRKRRNIWTEAVIERKQKRYLAKFWVHTVSATLLNRSNGSTILADRNMMFYLRLMWILENMFSIQWHSDTPSYGIDQTSNCQETNQSLWKKDS